MPFDATTIPAVTTALMDARQKLVECGWIQHRMRGQGGTCIAGAFSLDGFLDAQPFLLAAINEAHSQWGGWEKVPAFNDQFDRTKAEVLAVFDRAIELSWST